TLAKTYSPRSFVVVFRAMLVDSLVSVTSTPGTTPPESLTAPRKPPWKPWPNASPGLMTASNAPTMSVARNFISPLPSADAPGVSWMLELLARFSRRRVKRRNNSVHDCLRANRGSPFFRMARRDGPGRWCATLPTAGRTHDARAHLLPGVRAHHPHVCPGAAR